MTPEEKLLALIQADKRQAPAPAAEPVVPPAPAPAVVPPAPAPAPVKPAAPAVVAPPPEPAPAKITPPAAPAPAPAKTAAPAAAPSRAEPGPAAAMPKSEPKPEPATLKLKLVEDKLGVKESRDSAVKTAEPLASLPPEPLAPEPLAPLPAAPSSAFSLLLLNRILGVAVVALVLFLVFQIGSIRGGVAAAVEKQMQGAGALTVSPLSISEEAVPLLDTYLEKVGSRNLFVPRITPKDGSAPAVAETMGAPKDFKLVAISLDSSDASESTAIIRNKADSKTYFVKPGQTVGSTDYVLDRVASDRIVLKLRKQEFELK